MQKRKKDKLVQQGLFGEPIEDRRLTTAILPFDFQSHAVRVVMVKGEPWWVLSDVARVLGYRDATDAGRRVRPHQKGAHPLWTPGGEQELSVVNEGGVYRLIMRSNHPQAEEFQDWVTDVVLPSIRKTGGYALPAKSRVAKVAKRLKTDIETAKARCDQIDANKASHARLARENAAPRDYQQYHRAVYRGEFGKEIDAIRADLQIGPRATPLDHMEAIPLALNTHIKLLADRIIREQNVPLADQPRVVERLAREMADADLNRCGPEYVFAARDGGRRGRVLDVVRRQLPAAS